MPSKKVKPADKEMARAEKKAIRLFLKDKCGKSTAEQDKAVKDTTAKVTRKEVVANLLALAHVDIEQYRRAGGRML
jgi:hypothetical protein